MILGFCEQHLLQNSITEAASCGCSSVCSVTVTVLIWCKFRGSALQTILIALNQPGGQPISPANKSERRPEIMVPSSFQLGDARTSQQPLSNGTGQVAVSQAWWELAWWELPVGPSQAGSSTCLFGTLALLKNTHAPQDALCSSVFYKVLKIEAIS